MARKTVCHLRGELSLTWCMVSLSRCHGHLTGDAAAADALPPKRAMRFKEKEKKTETSGVRNHDHYLIRKKVRKENENKRFCSHSLNGSVWKSFFVRWKRLGVNYTLIDTSFFSVDLSFFGLEKV